ncbi:MAG: phosphate ABC transporter permease subunit PstC [Kiritimatiellae bacterium]|jgi:phosphate transport system permease protein|nr:phosphate ABC transporter permease subunit PstC [Kiritimatiellia bacterium]
MSKPTSETPFSAESIKKQGGGIFGVEWGTLIKAFFGGNAFVAMFVLALITIFLFREGAEFFPQYRKDMELYRASGQEFVGLLKTELDQFDILQQQLSEVQVQILTHLYDQGKEWEEVTRLTQPFQTFMDKTANAADPLRKVTQKAIDITAEAKEQVVVNNTRREITGVDLTALMNEEESAVYLNEARQQVMVMLPEVKEATQLFQEHLQAALNTIPEVEVPAAREALATYEESAAKFLEDIPRVADKLENYDPDRPYTMMQTFGGFLFGSQWTTNSSWQDFYGIWPLLSGSLLVTVVALAFAVPFGIFAAVYVNKVATPAEQNLIKPYIEFISAIPSVVIGFFGIAVFGTAIRALSEWDTLAWVPFFPISERLNAFTAGGLLALMAVPTIFTLAEDALNNVPKAFTEASEAMGATRWQTIWRIQIPTALSGIISAVLLGFGRVIGETMVVLLCAGNRIAVPDLSKGLGVFVEPVHTMTGIIAQEMGEVVPASIHYRALFCVGIFLFFLSLTINYIAQVIVRRYKISAG